MDPPEPGSVRASWLGRDFVKALALGADAIAVSNSGAAAIGCLGMRACRTNNYPVGIATQQPHPRQRLIVEEAATRLSRFFRVSAELMAALARACGHDHLAHFSPDDLTTFDRETARLSGVSYEGGSPRTASPRRGVALGIGPPGGSLIGQTASHLLR